MISKTWSSTHTREEDARRRGGDSRPEHGWAGGVAGLEAELGGRVAGAVVAWIFSIGRRPEFLSGSVFGRRKGNLPGSNSRVDHPQRSTRSKRVRMLSGILKQLEIRSCPYRVFWRYEGINCNPGENGELVAVGHRYS